MKKIRFVLLLCCVVLSSALLLVGCSAEEDNPTTPDFDISEYSGIYSDGKYLFDISFENGNYLCKDAAGRIGSGSCGYEYGSLYLSFDDFIYTIDTDTEGQFTLIQNGSGLDEESLDGLVLSLRPDEMYTIYDIDDLAGERSNADGVVINVDLGAKECTYSYENGVGGSNINDDSNGKGPYIYMGTYKAYPIIDTDGSVTFEIQKSSDFSEDDTVILSGTFTR